MDTDFIATRTARIPLNEHTLPIIRRTPPSNIHPLLQILHPIPTKLPQIRLRISPQHKPQRPLPSPLPHPLLRHALPSHDVYHRAHRLDGVSGLLAVLLSVASGDGLAEGCVVRDGAVDWGEDVGEGGGDYVCAVGTGLGDEDRDVELFDFVVEGFCVGCGGFDCGK